MGNFSKNMNITTLMFLCLVDLTGLCLFMPTIESRYIIGDDRSCSTQNDASSLKIEQDNKDKWVLVNNSNKHNIFKY